MEVVYQKECGGIFLSECHGEHHLPDYLGDMKKVLSSSAHVVPAGKFIGGEEVQFGGAVAFDIWYLDSESRLSHENFNIDYEFSCPNGGEAVDGAASVSVLSFALRPIGPRRISAKATLEASVCLRKSATYVFENEGDASALHTATREISVGNRWFSSPIEREYGEKIAVPAAYAGAEILHSGGCLHIERAAAQDGSVLVCGHYAVFVVLGMEGMPPLRLSERYPIEEQIALEGCAADMKATASGFFTSLTCNLQEGEEPAITFHGICELSAEAETNARISVVEDAFLESGGNCEGGILEYDTFSSANTMCRTAELVLPMSEGEGNVSDGVFHTTVLLKNSSHTLLQNEVQFTAEAEICALGYSLSEDGATHYASCRHTAPISIALPLDEPILADERLLVNATVGMCEGRVEEDRLHISLVLCFCIRGRTECQTQCVHRISPTNAEAGIFVPTYVVYYPTAQDTLWSVAKRYGVSPASIAACNHLSVTASDNGEHLPVSLLIDRRKKPI